MTQGHIWLGDQPKILLLWRIFLKILSSADGPEVLFLHLSYLSAVGWGKVGGKARKRILKQTNKINWRASLSFWIWNYPLCLNNSSLKYQCLPRNNIYGLDTQVLPSRSISSFPNLRKTLFLMKNQKGQWEPRHEINQDQHGSKKIKRIVHKEAQDLFFTE